jgi:hypothetical protein
MKPSILEDCAAGAMGPRTRGAVYNGLMLILSVAPSNEEKR